MDDERCMTQESNSDFCLGNGTVLLFYWQYFSKQMCLSKAWCSLISISIVFFDPSYVSKLIELFTNFELMIAQKQSSS
jgi:hypothetical protein